MSVRLSVARGNNFSIWLHYKSITKRPINLKFGQNIEGRVMYVLNLNRKLQIYALFCARGFGKPIVPISRIFAMHVPYAIMHV